MEQTWGNGKPGKGVRMEREEHTAWYGVLPRTSSDTMRCSIQPDSATILMGNPTTTFDRK